MACSIFDSFVPKWPNWSCASLLSSSSIYYWLASNVCKSDTSGSRRKVPFAVTHHIYKHWTIVLYHEYMWLCIATTWQLTDGSIHVAYREKCQDTSNLCIQYQRNPILHSFPNVPKQSTEQVDMWQRWIYRASSSQFKGGLHVTFV